MQPEPIVPSALTMYAITRHDLSLLDTLIQLFWQIFPDDRRYTASIRQSAHLAPEGTHRELFHLWLIAYEGKYIGLRLFNYLPLRNIGFGSYIGLLPAYRHRGIGRLIWQKIAEQLCVDAALKQRAVPLGLCSELADPAVARTPEQRRICEERVAIFKRMGAVILNVQYVEPVMIQDALVDDPLDLVGREPRPMLLQLTPIQPGKTITAQQTAEMVKGVLLDHYHFPANSSYVRDVLASIG